MKDVFYKMKELEDQGRIYNADAAYIRVSFLVKPSVLDFHVLPSMFATILQHRSTLIDWILQVGDASNLNTTTVHVAVSYVKICAQNFQIAKFTVVIFFSYRSVYLIVSCN